MYALSKTGLQTRKCGINTEQYRESMFTEITGVHLYKTVPGSSSCLICCMHIVIWSVRDRQMRHKWRSSPWTLERSPEPCLVDISLPPYTTHWRDQENNVWATIHIEDWTACWQSELPPMVALQTLITSRLMLVLFRNTNLWLSWICLGNNCSVEWISFKSLSSPDSFLTTLLDCFVRMP